MGTLSHTGNVIHDYQILPRHDGKPKAEKFCRSCGTSLPKRAIKPTGIQLFYCSPDCAYAASIHAAMKGYASPEYCKARNTAKGK